MVKISPLPSLPKRGKTGEMVHSITRRAGIKNRVKDCRKHLKLQIENPAFGGTETENLKSEA
jgi:hypothetical protein